MEHGGFELGKLGWFAGWLVAVLILFLAGTRLPLALRHGRLRATAFHAAIVAGAVGVAVLANVALTLNDAHIDLTREKIYTPSAQAMKVVVEREGVDQASPGTGVVYFARVSARRTQSRMSRIVGTPEYKQMTIRNWSTTTKLLALLDG